MFAFFVLLFVLVIIYLFTESTKVSSTTTKEGFNPVNTSPEHTVNIPVNVIPPPISPPPVRSISDANVKPADLPGNLPIAPYEQIAANSPLPYQEPSLIKAKRQELINTLEDLRGFLAFEAQEISERSDPAIQLPLNTARGDFKVLQNEVYVLNRNPGIQPNITQLQLAEIQANLGYLQETVRLIGAAGPIQGPIYEFTTPINVAIKEGFEGQSLNGEIATPQDLQDFVARISGEIIRLTASGTTDPVINARVVALTQMKQNVETIIHQVSSGALMSTDIPIMKKDIQNAFPILGKLSEPLPQIIKTLNLPAGLGNLLPSNIQKDPETMREINKLIDKYGQQFINGVSASASFNINYTSPRDTLRNANGLQRDKSANSTIDQTGFPSSSDLMNASGLTEQNKLLLSGNGNLTDVYADKPEEQGRGPSHFDWKTRAKQIEGQVKKRGLNPSDFGIMPEGTHVSKDFSWKGYTRMICTRLQATMDPALPETCGCPPMNWKGWGITNN
jgi:hypothetical protein